MKKALIIIFALIGIVIFSFYYYVLWSPYGVRTQRNARMVEEISVGIKLDSVLTIMGKPDSIFGSYLNDGLIIYQYEPPFASSDGIDIYIDSTLIVRRVIFE